MSQKTYLSFDEIVRYLGGTGRRNIKEGECVLNAGLVMLVGHQNRTKESLNILALVLQTSGISKEPLQVTGRVEVCDSVEVKNFLCSCKAGESGSCKHVAAVLWYLNRNDVNSLEELSSTDVKCLWSKRKSLNKAQYSARKLRDFCHVKPSCPPAPQLSEEFLEHCFNSLVSVSPGSALALQMGMGSLEEDAGSRGVGEDNENL